LVVNDYPIGAVFRGPAPATVRASKL